MRTSNPALSERALEGLHLADGARMTVNGTVNKTFIMLALVVAGAGWTWFQMKLNPGAAMTFAMIGGIGGFVLSLVAVFKKEWITWIAPVYAILEGLFIGAISMIYEAKYPGIVIQAVGLSFATLFSLLAAYKVGLIKVTQTFRNIVVAATMALMTFYLVSFVLSFFDISMPLIHNTGLLGIGFSLFAVGLAALNLVLDFDFVEEGAAAGLPKMMEWYGAFALTVTLVWLYIELLRLLSKLRR